MFELNEKITIVASSCSKKIGPRKGSIGYVMPYSQAFSSIPNIDIIAEYVNVAFLRYGYEKKYRVERAEVIAIFPMLNSPREPIMKERLGMLNRYINSDNSKATIFKTKTRKVFNASERVPIVLALPTFTPRADLATCSDEEFACWFSTCILSSQINSFVNTALFTKHNIENVDALRILQNASVDKHAKEHLVNTVCKNAQLRHKWIAVLKMITITMRHTNMREIIRDTYHELDAMDAGSLQVKERVYHSFGKYIFKPEFSKIITISKKYERHRKVARILYKMKYTKDYLLASID